jgi:hypothetical protein
VPPHRAREAARRTHGEAILFYVDNALFVVRKDDYKRGRRSDDGILAFEAGRARFVVAPQG